MVTRLDRLARSIRDLLNILDAVGKAGAAFKPHGRLMLTVLGGLAEYPRQNRRRPRPREGTGPCASVARLHQRREAMERLAQGAAQAELARSYGVSQSTISRLAAPGPFEASAVGA